MTQFYQNNMPYYIGQWENDMKNGEGKMYNQIGKLYYEGQWKNNLPHGQGKYYREDGTLIYDGQWEIICIMVKVILSR